MDSVVSIGSVQSKGKKGRKLSKRNRWKEWEAGWKEGTKGRHKRKAEREVCLCAHAIKEATRNMEHMSV